MRIRIKRSSGNVFRDIGFSREEAAHLLVRADLMVQLSRIIKRRGLTQAQAAKAMGVTQPRVSNLTRGRIEKFSIDTLVDMLARLGVAVTIKARGRTVA
jgi:predicted XRE-type DNA-binding protein